MLRFCWTERSGRIPARFRSSWRKPTPASRASPGEPGAKRRAAELHRSRPDGQSPEDGLREVRLPCAGHAADPHDLASPDLQVHVPQHGAGGEAGKSQHHLALLRPGSRCVMDSTSRPTMRRTSSASRRPGDAQRRHVAAVAQHRGPVGHLEDLLEMVAHVDDRAALVAQPPDDTHQARDLGAVEGGRRLVHDDDAALGGERPGDLDELLGGHADVRHAGVGVDVHARACANSSRQLRPDLARTGCPATAGRSARGRCTRSRPR